MHTTSYRHERAHAASARYKRENARAVTYRVDDRLSYLPSMLTHKSDGCSTSARHPLCTPQLPVGNDSARQFAHLCVGK
jgi:hypothetical protein